MFYLRRCKKLQFLLLAVLLSCILLLIRIKITRSFFLIFLIWNLFLAAVPYMISSWVSGRISSNKLELLLLGMACILFLPNAPYIVTDLRHIKHSSGNFIWVDIAIIYSFSIYGLLFYYLTLIDMAVVLRRFLKRRIVDYALVVVCFLSGFGVYLGRVLRYNSWDIISEPYLLFSDIKNLVLEYHLHLDAWCFITGFDIFLYLGYSIYNMINKRQLV